MTQAKTKDNYSRIIKDQELPNITEKLYEQNVELAIRNRTLSVLREMYDIINTSLEVRQTAQKLVDEIVQQLNFQKSFIALINKEQGILKTVAVSQSIGEAQKVVEKFGHPFKNFNISLKNTENFCVDSVINKRQRLTNVLYDILISRVKEEDAKEIQDKLNIKTIILYPLFFGKKVLGVLVLGMDKHVGFLSRAEREVLKELIEVVSIAIERSQIYADLKDANHRLKTMDKLKDEFISVTSHELRTPMTAIKSYLWMLLNKKKDLLDDKAKEYLVKSYVSTERTINLVNDMLDVSRIESGRLEINKEPADLVILAKEVSEQLSFKASEKWIDLTVEDKQLPQVICDKDRTRQLFFNLIGNAVKFTPEKGKVSTEFELKGNKVEVRVKDNGPGISKQDKERLFKKFSRLENSFVSMAESGGTGLGLFISKQIIGLLDGDIWVESELGKGSTFCFTLPVAK